jgi:DNA-binding response OmpR family regulator
MAAVEKILIIDDFEPFRATACRVVERLGYHVISASDGIRGLDLFSRERPGIVITDLQMPQVDGAAVLHAIKEKSPHTAVVVLTGFATEALEKELLRQGAFACLRKPLNLDRLVQVISQIQAKRRAVNQDVRPRAFLRVDSDPCRRVLERALQTNGCDTVVPSTVDDWRGPLERGELDVLVWEVHVDDKDVLKRVLENRSARSGFEVILLLTESGPAELVAREILQTFPVECVSAPLDDELVAAVFQRAFHRLLVRRNALFKRERLNVGSLRVGVGAGGRTGSGRPRRQCGFDGLVKRGVVAPAVGVGVAGSVVGGGVRQPGSGDLVGPSAGPTGSAPVGRAGTPGVVTSSAGRRVPGVDPMRPGRNLPGSQPPRRGGNSVGQDFSLVGGDRPFRRVILSLRAAALFAG